MSKKLHLFPNVLDSLFNIGDTVIEIVKIVVIAVVIVDQRLLLLWGRFFHNITILLWVGRR